MSTHSQHRTARPELATPMACIALPELGVTLQGVSVAGVETWVRIPEWSICFDVGRSPEVAVRCRYLALTHAHMDHAGGLAQYLAMRNLYGHTPTTVFAPEPICAELLTIVHAWERLHGNPFEWTLRPMAPGQEHDIGGGRTLRAFAVQHVVPALGYAVLVKPPRLRPEFASMSQDSLRDLRGQGVELTAPCERVRLAISGDTRITALQTARELREAEVVLLETTFLDRQRSILDTHVGGHVHLDEIAEHADLLSAVKRLVPYHISQLYNVQTVPQLMQARLPEGLWARTTPLLVAAT